MKRKKVNDILSIGELLIDFISTDYVASLEDTNTFKRIPGGSPANMVMNMARLGNKTQLVSCVGQDDLGNYLKGFVKKHDVDCSNLWQVAKPTTLILVTKSKDVANFEAYRGADCQISAGQLTDELLQASCIFHTTCFALSLEPAQSAIMDAARRAFAMGCQLSIDANYAQKIWNDRHQAQQIVQEYCAMGAIVKVSEVDWERLYQSPLTDANAAAKHFLNLGAKVVCVTLGGEGCYVATANENHFLAARKVEVKDTTGAGDAFWSGFLTAWLDEHQLLDCLKAGRRMAEEKIQHFGPLPLKVDRQKIYEDIS